MEINSLAVDHITAQRRRDLVHEAPVERQRVLPWSREVTEILAKISGSERFDDPLAASKVKREAGTVLPLPNGAELTTKIAQIDKAGHSEISHELKFPLKNSLSAGIHDKTPEPELIISSHRNHLIENPESRNPLVVKILNDNTQSASEKIALMMKESLVDFSEIEKIRQHFLVKYSEPGLKPDIEEKARKAQEFLEFKSILDSTKLNDAQKFAQIQERAMFPELLKASQEKANQKYPNVEDRSHSYYMSIIDDLNEQYSKKRQDYETLQMAKLEQKNQKITDSIIDMLKLSKLQRTLKLSTYTPDEKLNIIRDEKLLPEKELSKIKLDLESKSVEQVIKSLMKDSEYGTRQITSSLAGINSASKLDKSPEDAFPVLTSKVLYLGDPKSQQTLNVTMKWIYPNLDEETKKLTQKALELMKVDSLKPEQSFDHVMKLLISEINPPSSFNSIKLNERETLIHNAEKAFQGADASGFKIAMNNLFDSYKGEAKNNKQFEQLFKLAENHLTSMILNRENDQKSIIQRPEISASSPERMMSEQFKAHAAERDKLMRKLKNLDTLEASEIALSTSNIIKDIYKELPEELQKASKAEYDNLQLSLAKLKMTINDNPDVSVKRELRQEVIDAQKTVNTAMEKFGEKILPEQPSLKAEFLEKLTSIQEKEWAASLERQQEILKASGLPEYQTNQQVLDKHAGMASLMSMIQSNSPKGTALEITIKEGQKEISKFDFSPDANQAAPSKMLRIGEFNIPIPGAPGSAEGAHTDKEGNKISVANGFVIISDRENHTKRLITPQGTDIEFHPKGTPHKVQLEEKYMASSRYTMAEPGNRQLKANLAALQRKTGASAGLSKATTNNSTPVSSIQTKYGEVYGMEPNGYYTFEIKNNGKFIAYDADPERTKSHNFNAPKTTVFET